MQSTTRLAAKRLPLLQRPGSSTGQYAGTSGGPVAQQAADVFYKCGVEVAKVVYTQIDARYPFSARSKDMRIGQEHMRRMDEAKRILNEQRNLVIKEILPMFDVRMRKTNDLVTEADAHANDYIVKNAFDFMVKTFKAWSDRFVEQGDVETLDRTIDKVAAIAREQLEGKLVNFAFSFRPVPLPSQQIRK
jgi:hypothetical protein